MPGGGGGAPAPHPGGGGGGMEVILGADGEATIVREG